MIAQSKILKIILLVIILVAIFWGSNTVENYFKTIIASITNTNYFDSESWSSMAIFGALAVLSVMLVSFSSIWIIPIAISLWGDSLTLALLLAGWLLGSIFSYIIGRYAGYPIVRKIISEEKINNYSEIFSRARESFNLIILSRFALPSEIPGYLLGIAKYPFFKYLFATIISEIPYAIVAVYFIDAIINKNITVFLFAGIIWIIAAMAMVKMYKKVVSEKNTTMLS